MWSRNLDSPPGRSLARISTAEDVKVRVSSAASICAAIRVPAVVGYVLFEVRRSVFVMSPATISATTPKITMETTTSNMVKPS